MVVHQPEPLWCCPLGLVMGAAYERARARYDGAEQAGRDQDVQAAYAAMLVALVNWCEHQIDAHDTDPGPVEQCPDCPPLPAPPTSPTAAGPRTELGDPANQFLARAAADRAAGLLNQALKRRRNPLVDPVRRLTPEQDAARLAAYQSSHDEAASPA